MEIYREKKFECEDLLETEVEKAMEQAKTSKSFRTPLDCQGAAYIHKNCDKVWCNQDCPLFRYHNRANKINYNLD